eukprot:MONOS_16231.1-p1 / transcript=MONOS_16231.1 / gene=MONOS_16231 / organism=Monocercomonoides_exilis_PA203 / gene_product=unspecified product / transcript_product=unspecified product / location=Mono_scaffold01577:4788-5147(+) / protein_length=120 / sequence_SO=supercontig / SO=protein_coding / is_pseudo=false
MFGPGSRCEQNRMETAGAIGMCFCSVLSNVSWTSSGVQARLEFVVRELVQCGLYFQIIVRGVDGGKWVRTYSFEGTMQNTERRGFGRIGWGGGGLIEESGQEEEVLAQVVYLSEELGVE